MSFDKAAYEAAKARDIAGRMAKKASTERWKSEWAEFHRNGKTGPRPPSRYDHLADDDAGIRYTHIDVTEEGRVVGVLCAERRFCRGDSAFVDLAVDVDLAVVQRLVDGVRARSQERRKESAQRAVVTRRKRHDLAVYALVERLKAGGKLSPSQHCVLCRRGLTDDESIGRGIGSECWGEVMELLTAAQDRKREAAT